MNYQDTLIIPKVCDPISKNLHYYFPEQQQQQPTNNKKDDTNNIKEDEKKPSSSFLLNLPYELRHEIYRFSIVDSRHPPAETVHGDILRATWEDLPSPLLWVNQQIRTEVFEFLQKAPLTMRVTWQDHKLDCLALSALIAQGRIRTHGYSRDIPHLILEVWPPVRDRPIDVYWIWRRLKLLRDKIRAAELRVSRFDLVFLENEVTSWSYLHGTPGYWISHLSEFPEAWTPWNSDMACILSLFNRLTKIAEAHIYLPGSLIANGRNVELADMAQLTEEGMMRIHTTEKTDRYNNIFNHWERIFDHADEFLEHQTAVSARDKLIIMTHDGMEKLSVAEYDQFVTIWPHFDRLGDHSRGGPFEGMWYYTQAPETSSENLLSPAALLQELPFHEEES